MKRFFLVLLILLFITMLTSCNNDKLENDGSLDNKQEEKAGYKEIYISAIEEILKQGPPLSDFKYLAIKMDTLKGITKSEKDDIKKYFQDKYNEVKVADYNSLKKSLKYDSYVRNGIVIKIDRINEFTDERVSFETSVYIVPLASFGLGFEFEKSNSRWDMLKVKLVWIS